MQHRPDAPELLAAVADVLDGELRPALPAELQHQARVAANLCRLVERELRLGPGAAQRERALLAGVLGRDGDAAELSAALARVLRAGADPDLERAAWEALVAVTADDLAIAKPGHDAWDGP